MRKLAILLGVLAMATAVQAATITVVKQSYGTLNYQLKVDGQLVTKMVGGVPTIDANDAVQMASLGLEVGQPFTLSILVNTDSKTIAGSNRGVVQYFANINSTGGIAPAVAMTLLVNEDGDPILDGEGNEQYVPATVVADGVTYNQWDSTIPADFSNGPQKGWLNAGKLVNSVGGAIPSTIWNTTPYFNRYGAGTSYTQVASGLMTWDGSSTTLSVSGVASAQRLAGKTDIITLTDDVETSRVTQNDVGMPLAVNGYAINFVGVPEPVTMSLLVIGGLGLLARRNRRA